MALTGTKLRQWGVRFFRAGLLAAVLLALRFQGGGASPDAEIALEQARLLFPAAFALRPGDDLTTVLGEDESTLGFVAKTLPKSRNIVGYSGPSDILIGLDGEGAVTGTALLWSGDTSEHSDAVRAVPEFFDGFAGWTFAGDNDPGGIDAVSGATLTSLALIESVTVRLGGERPSLKFPEPPALADVRRLFPEAVALGAPDGPASTTPVLDADGNEIGTLLRTSPFADGIAGYQGPSDGLVGLETGGTVRGITLSATYDNQRYADYVRTDTRFTERHRGKSVAELAGLDADRFWADGVSGATMTSGAVMEAVSERARVFLAPPEDAPAATRSLRLEGRDAVTLLAIALGCAVAFSRLRANAFARVALYLYLIIALGLWAGDMVSLAVFGGWAQGAVPYARAPGLVALAAAALALPWGTGKPVYCQHLCPHGAAQYLVFRIVPARIRVPARLHRILAAGPFLFLAGGVAIAAGGLPVSLSALEPFDAWIFGIGGAAAIAIAIAGLAAAAFIPQAYCKYGCPTGLVLDYVRARRHETALTRRDAWAVGLLVIAIMLGYIGSG